MKYILLIPELLIFIIFLIPVFSGILNSGNIIGLTISILLFFITLYFDKFKILCCNYYQNSAGKIILIILSIIITICIIYASVISGFMIHSQLKSPENVKAIVVLGCKVKEYKPSRMLSRRLDSAYNFLKENDNVICIVSGGKGDDEKISEAYVMKTYLIEKGIDTDRIIMEDKSKNTLENLKYSANILNQYGINNIAIATDGFHQYRAGYIAKKFGLNPSSVNAEMDYLTICITPTYWIREWLAIFNEYIKP